ncbi:hydroxymethylglutaryl-CoA lyase [Desulfotomaculum copahuensis]|uniref:hydroxymethylglutaryl-CoA lyase n=1 Tax=Desulfotomaculum copahuensis TaxID=1838280 RepID=UPI000A732876|nr:hydroxymethylglutaryl-CoA lyase [Desulfotomaculum copahuensis]
MHWPEKVLIREVGPRDGLQNEAAFVPTAVKVQLLAALAGAGVKAIEATSFVHPRAVPQLRDAEAVMEGLDRLFMRGNDGVKSPAAPVISALTGNMRGLERAVRAGVKEVVAVVSASEAHNRANMHMSVEASLRQVREMGAAAAAGGVRLRGAVATAFGCPYQGDIAPGLVAGVVEGMLQAGVDEITLADTAGLGNPRQVYDLVTLLASCYPRVTWALHFHDNRGLALANCVTGLQAGVRILEGSVAGLGGCPFIPGAAGNAATEDLVYMLHRMGIDTGIDLDALAGCAGLLEEHLGRKICRNRV